jgi:carbamoyl-phosphate synthase large subunit
MKEKAELLEEVRKLKDFGVKFYATYGTADFLQKNGIESEILYWPLDKKEPNIMTYLNEGMIDLVINIPKNEDKYHLDNDYVVRRKAVDLNINLITNTQVAKRFIKAISRYKDQKLPVKSWDEYI